VRHTNLKVFHQRGIEGRRKAHHDGRRGATCRGQPRRTGAGPERSKCGKVSAWCTKLAIIFVIEWSLGKQCLRKLNHVWNIMHDI
jgi:hypothetical protein